jgi:hypothetical protein
VREEPQLNSGNVEDIEAGILSDDNAPKGFTDRTVRKKPGRMENVRLMTGNETPE